VILEASSRPLSLRRVPPNLLVGEGATAFAYEHDVNVVPHDALVSRSARERFLRWRDDLKRAGRAQLTPDTPNSRSSTGDEDMIDLEYEERVRNKQRRDHTNAMLSGTWNEGQPDSPQSQSPAPVNSSGESLPYDNYSPKSTDTQPGTPPSPEKFSLASQSPLLPLSRSPSDQGSRDGSSPAKRARFGAFRSSDGQSRMHSLLGPTAESLKSTLDANLTFTGMAAIHNAHQAEGTDGPTSPTKNDLSTLDDAFSPPSRETTPRATPMDFDEDFITDTVGAIAIDIFGNIAAGSSSGGIGMKHRGRVGPAALVGIGTAVIPVDPQDPEGITVAAVTSGTGEHMATTMASQKCAERLYFCNRRGAGRVNIAATEEEAMHSFVQNDFMDHPGVKNGHSGGAIGVMAVKKTPYGYFLHFAHNTDSFALTSMHSNEKEAKCVMSRIGDHANVVQGGRKIRVK
jgi:taspase, threonine aspartase, 1